MVNRYDNPAQAEFINTYVPIPFEQLYTLGKQAKEDVEKAMDTMNTTLNKWYEFRSPSEVDTKAYHDLTIGRAKPIVEKLTQNLDMLKSAEGRAQINSLIHNVDHVSLRELEQSRDQMIAGEEYRQKLALNGKFNWDWHGVEWANYDTLGIKGARAGVFSDISPMAYTSIKDLTSKYFDNLDPSFIESKGGYDYFGVTPERLGEIAEQNRTGILDTPEAQKHIDIIQSKTGLTREDATNAFMQSVVQDNLEYTNRNRKANEFALLASRQAGSGSGSGKENLPPVHFVDRLTTAMLKGGPLDETGVPTSPSALTRLASRVDAASPYRAAYISGADATGKALGGGFIRNSEGKIISRAPVAEAFLKDTFMDIGSYATDINETMFQTKPIIGLKGQPIYSGTGLTGVIPAESFTNMIMGVPDADLGYTEEKKTFFDDVANGKIQGMAVSPTTKAMLTNPNIQGEQATADNGFEQEYKVYVPAKEIARLVGVKYPGDTEDGWKEFQDDKKVQAYIKSLGGVIASTTGHLIEQDYLKLDSDSKNSAYDHTKEGWFWNKTENFDVARNFSGRYYEFPAVRTVLNNTMLRENVNRQERLDSNLGTASNEKHRFDDVNKTHGL